MRLTNKHTRLTLITSSRMITSPAMILIVLLCFCGDFNLNALVKNMAKQKNSFSHSNYFNNVENKLEMASPASMSDISTQMREMREAMRKDEKTAMLVRWI